MHRLAAVLAVALLGALTGPTHHTTPPGPEEMIVLESEGRIEPQLGTQDFERELEAREEERRTKAELLALAANRLMAVQTLNLIEREIDALPTKEEVSPEWFHDVFLGLIYVAEQAGATTEEISFQLDRLYSMARLGKYHFASLSDLKTEVDLIKEKLARRDLLAEH